MTIPRLTTGYSVYSAEAEARRKRNTLEALYPKLPQSKFDIIYADPPWDYGGKLQFDRTSKASDKIDLKKGIFISSASFQYPTLTLQEIAKLPLIDIARPDCLLFMWATSPHLQQAIELGKAWGFSYRTVAFIWDKMIHNPGKYTLSNCELCLVFKRGRIPSPRGARNIQQLVRAPRGKHSAKPTAVRNFINDMFPTQTKIELFARQTAPGWHVWGLETFENDAIVTGNQKEEPCSLQQQMF
ncbi:MAG TPA: MT-A70 family methyltransferase [Acidobacteriaceae bacterium]|nr:MT-A70 family methyltransferase [Acidobacteriaceae bacterium]